MEVRLTSHIRASFLSSLAGNLRDRVEGARRITEEQKAILDKIRGVHRFFQHLEEICNSIKEVSQAAGHPLPR